MSNMVDTLSSYPTPLGSVCHMGLVQVTAGNQTWSVSCPSCPCSLCSPLVSTSSPPTTATNMWTDLTRSALPVWCWVCQHPCLWWVLYMCVDSVHVCVCIHVHMCMYCYCTHTYSINLCHLLHTVLYWLLVKLPRFVKSHDRHMDQWSHLPPSCGLY